MEKTEEKDLTTEERAVRAFEKADTCTSSRWQETLTLTKFVEIITKSDVYKNMSEEERAMRFMVVGYYMISLYDNAYQSMSLPEVLKGLKLPNSATVVAECTSQTEES